ncbi:MAG TPA: lipoyl(octanoyl) transferase LipB, partial [Bdellovibrionota bacterium]|nr:lipoyl(octanoyl) transferase LipB [Bdellovibrionota bacterium]
MLETGATSESRPRESRVCLASGAEVRFLSLPGQVPYEAARTLQLELVEQRAAGRIPDTVLFLEHAPVVTRGRGLQVPQGAKAADQMRAMPLSEELLREKGISIAESERGGDLTYHGPGQLVIYPIVKLDGGGLGARKDIHAHLRWLEGGLISLIGAFGLKASTRQDATGVWVGEGPAARKVASLGIAVRKWVTYHGMAVNVVNDLAPFHLISPCGFSPEVMGRLQDLGPAFAESWSKTGWRLWLEAELAARLCAGAHWAGVRWGS